jgi:hypothetical protein
MFQLRNKLNTFVVSNEMSQLLSEHAQKFLAPVSNVLQSKKNVKNKAIDDKDRLSKPRSQIKGIELLRNPSLFKVSLY